MPTLPQLKTFFHSKYLILLTSLIATIVCWWPARNSPYHWDAAGYLTTYADFLLRNNFRLPEDAMYDYVHGPLLAYMIAGAWFMGGQNTLMAHLVMLPFGWLYLVTVFKLGKSYLSETGAWCLWFLCLTMPVFVSQLRTVYNDLPVGALSLATLLAIEQNRRFQAILFLSSAVLIKDTALGIIPYWWWRLWRERKQTTWKEWVYSLIPLAAYSWWMVEHYFLYDYWWFKPGVTWGNPVGIEQWRASAAWFGIELLLIQGRWWILIGLLMGTLVWLQMKKLPTKAEKDLADLQKMIVYVVFMSGIFILPSWRHTKYFLGFLPVVYMIGMWGLVWLIEFVIPQRKRAAIGGYLLLFILGVWQLCLWQPGYSSSIKDLFMPQERDLSYQLMLENWIDAATLVESRYASMLILGSFPENYQLTQPFQGYVKSPLRFDFCDKRIASTVIPTEAVIIYRHEYAPGQSACEQLIATYGGSRLHRWDRKGWWLELWYVPLDKRLSTNQPNAGEANKTEEKFATNSN